MTCDEAGILLHALIDGELDAGHARELENHVADCPRCAAELAAYREMSKAVAGAGLRYAAPPQLRRRIEASLPQTRAPSRRAVLRGFAMGSAVSAIAATGLVAFENTGVLWANDQFSLMALWSGVVWADPTQYAQPIVWTSGELIPDGELIPNGELIPDSELLPDGELIPDAVGVDWSNTALWSAPVLAPEVSPLPLILPLSTGFQDP